MLDRIPSEVIEVLASMHAPQPDGALGRNRAGYFHARFQYGAHRLADAAVHRKDPALVEAFLRSLTYAFEHQEPDGSFALRVPDRLRNAGTPSPGDLASATAFFLSTAGAGLYALDESAWFKTSPETAEHRDAVEQLRDPLRLALDYLVAQRELLVAYDAAAPNRLLIDGLAFYSLGERFDDAAAVGLGEEFVARALRTQHPDGYFVEGGGHDSSYNGVALAIGYRLIALGCDIPGLRAALTRATEWQAGRILSTGEISTQGNRRVYPGGEAFLGREKDVDAGHTVEAFALAYGITGVPEYRELALRTLRHYAPRKVPSSE